MNTSAAHVDRAAALVDLGRPREALAAAEAALASQPDNAEARITLVRIRIRLGDWWEALEAGWEALDHAPDDWRIFYLLSIAHRQRSEYHEAVETARDAVSLSPNNPYAHVTLGQALSMRARSWREAARAIDRALALAPDNPEVLRGAGTAALERRRPKLAIGYFQEALAIEPNHAETISDLALAQARRFNLRDALFGYTSAAALKPSLQTPHNNIVSAVGRLLLITYPAILFAALFAMTVTPRLPLILPYALYLGLQTRGHGRDLRTIVWPVIRGQGRVFTSLVVLALGLLAVLLVVPFLPQPAARQVAALVTEVAFLPAMALMILFILIKHLHYRQHRA